MLPSSGVDALKCGKSALSCSMTLYIQACHDVFSVDAGREPKGIAPASVPGAGPSSALIVTGSEPTLEITQWGLYPRASALPSTAAVAPGMVSRKTTLQPPACSFMTNGVKYDPGGVADTKLTTL